MIKKIICLILLCLCISCSNNTNSNIDKNKNLLTEPETLYKIAKINFDGQNFELDTHISADVDSVTLGGLGKPLELNLAGLGSVPFTNVSRIF